MIEINLRPGQKRARGGSPFAGLQAQLSGLRERMRDPLPLVAAGVDPVHLGMVVVFNLMIGLVTPPMGLALFLVADIAKVRMQDVLREMLPYYVPLFVTLGLITFFPMLSLWLPRWAVG